MKASNESRVRSRDNMDGETAIAFAANHFERIHPKCSCPEWLPRCTSIGYHWDSDDNYIVSFAFTLKATNDGVSYFKVLVDPMTAETTVLLDRGFDDLVGEDLQGFEPQHSPAG